MAKILDDEYFLDEVDEDSFLCTIFLLASMLIYFYVT